MQSRYEVRAIPAMGSNHRWCAQRPWGKEVRAVSVVDVEGEREKDADGQPLPRYAKLHDKRVVYEFGDEITINDLAELKADPHISVSHVDGNSVSADEVNDAKIRAQRLEQELADARREFQGLQEEMKAREIAVQEHDVGAATKIAQLQQQLASSNAQLERNKAKK